MTDQHTGGYPSEVPPPPPPPSVPSFDVTPSAGSADVIAHEPKRRGASPVIAGVSALAVVVAGAGVVGVMKLTGGKGSATALAKYAPSTSFMYAEIDLAPSNTERGRLWSALKKFPSSTANKAGVSEDNLRDALLKAALADSEHVDYTHDVQPWLGDGAAFAGIMVDGKPTAVGLLDVKDETKAKSGLTHIKSQNNNFYYVVHDGHAVISSDKAAVDAADADAKAHPLSGNANFTSDVKGLGADQLVTAWSDLGLAKAALNAGLPNVEQFKMFQSSGALDSLKGRVSIGFTVDDGGVAVVTGRITGGEKLHGSGAAAKIVATLPDDTIAAVGFGDVSKGVDRVTQQLDKMSGLFGGANPIASVAEGVQSATGLSFPDDIVTLLGDRSAIALGSLPQSGSGGLPEFGIRSHPKDLAKAKDLADTLSQHLSSNGVDIGSKTAGDDLVLASTPAYADKLAGSGGLGNSAAYKKAVGDTSGANFIAYVDFTKIRDRFGLNNDNFGAVGSAAIVERTDGDAQVVQIRLVTR